jgi:hypothetical protein
VVVGTGVRGDEEVPREGGDGLEDGRQWIPARKWHRGGGQGLAQSRECGNSELQLQAQSCRSGNSGELAISSSRPRTGSERSGGLRSRAVGRGRREPRRAPVKRRG